MKKLLLTLSLAFLPLLPGAAFAATYVHEQFVPYKGYSSISQDGTGRYSSQHMYWRTGGLAAYDSWNDTYEHETVFYNYDGGAYATTATAWQTNLPDPYMDTQALDGSNEFNIAIGTFDPDTIQAGAMYDYFVRLDSPASARSYYKISGQKGYSGCEAGAWCVENEQTATLIPFKDPFRAPGYGAFLYEWENNNSTSAADRIYVGDWGTGVMNSITDKDYFVFEVTYERTVNFILKVPQSAGIDYDIIIYDNNNSVVANSMNGSGQDEIFFKYLSAGNYYAKIYSYSGSDAIKTYSFIPY